MLVWRTFGMIRTLDQEVASSIHDRVQVLNNSGQVVHAHLPQCRQSLLLYGVVKQGTFTLIWRTMTHRIESGVD